MRRGTVLLGGVLIAAAASIAGASGASEDLAPAAEAFSAQRALPGMTAPDFQLESLGGRTVRLSDFRGKAVLLNFWATWCTPCRAEIPWLADLSTKFRSEGLEIIGVSMDDGDRAKILSFGRDRNVPYTILLGEESVGAAYGGIRHLPQTFLIGRDGRIAQSISGIVTSGDLELGIRRMLKTLSFERNLPP